jgi:two-component system NtrC family sensor kinase
VPERDDVDPTQEVSRVQQRMIHAEKMAALGRLAGAVAHELNNPLSAIVMYARLVERELETSGLGPETREELGRYVSQIQKDARRCGSVVGNLLLFARRSGGKFALHRVNDLIARSVTLVGHYLHIAHIEVETHPLDGDDALACDADHVQQAFVALLLNAAEAMPGGGRLTVRAWAAEASICVEISGIDGGAPHETPSHALEPSVPTGSTAGAARLGLPSVDIIVQQHGGSIEIDSAAGHATRVRVVLPRKPSPAAVASA